MILYTTCIYGTLGQPCAVRYALTCCVTTVAVACPLSAEELLYDKNVSLKACSCMLAHEVKTFKKYTSGQSVTFTHLKK